ncbi:acyltransferase family protein [Pseudomonas chlororaphis]|uniref:acyltransferase family protein n=1 Tax=Pseudomonas chlororaphis TaxID=587753 RepID=UPI0009B944ED|nr:acyltransferase [Pseudomonas chlororaphis]
MKTEYSFEVIAITLAIVMVFVLFSTLFKEKIESAEVPHAYKFINGMRGLAAIFVFINHAPFVLANLGVQNTVFSSWGQLYPNLGSFGVQIFFCITGFLFFDKIIKNEKIDWVEFFIARIKRVAPLYYVSSLLVFIIAASFAGFNILEKDSLITVAGLLSFNFIDNPMRIGDVSLVPLSSVTWTLIHEWRFYAVLPLVAICYRSKYKVLIMVVAMMLAAVDLGYSVNVCWAYFLSGIVAAIVHKTAVTNKLVKGMAVVVAAVAFVITCGVVEVPGYGALRFMLTTVFFLCITISNPSFLHFQFLNRMSDISYSIYLLHLPILFLCFKAVSGVVELSSVDKFTFWAINFSTIPLIVLVSTFTFINIEKRFMRKTKIQRAEVGLVRSA